jgi:hypothetical protein
LYSCNAALFESFATLLPKCNGASVSADDSLDLRLDDGASIADRQRIEVASWWARNRDDLSAPGLAGGETKLVALLVYVRPRPAENVRPLGAF